MKDPQSNAMWTCLGSKNPLLFQTSLLILNPNWITCAPNFCEKSEEEATSNLLNVTGHKDEKNRFTVGDVYVQHRYPMSERVRCAVIETDTVSISELRIALAKAEQMTDTLFESVLKLSKHRETQYEVEADIKSTSGSDQIRVVKIILEKPLVSV